jgi:uncharacterized membrane protein YidH (DUF202 family)
MKTLYFYLVVINFTAFFIINPPSSAGQFENLQLIGSILPALIISCINSAVLPVGIVIFRKYREDRYTDPTIETFLSLALMIISVTITYYQVRYV